MRSAWLLVATTACGPKAIAPGSPDQSVRDAMRLVCDAPSRADSDRSSATRSDKIAGHLTDGVGNTKVLMTVEAWKTDGINRAELDALVKEAKLADCKLRAEAVAFADIEDGDGIADHRDPCPITAPVSDRDRDGCPDINDDQFGPFQTGANE